jgi:hypothetical protein
VLARRRLVTTLGVAAYDLFDQSADPNAPSLTFRARLRYDADYGGSAGESEVTNFGALDSDAPAGRASEGPGQGAIIALPRVGGLHHRYARAA